MGKDELEERIRKLEHENYVLKYVVYKNCFNPDSYFSMNPGYDNEILWEFLQIMQDFKKGIRE